MAKSIYCVLRSGGPDYDERHVRWLKKQCEEFAPGVPFICLTDLPSIDDVTTEPLLHGWEGWWSKLELFRYSEVFYLDLDTVLVNDVRHMLHLDGFHALRNFGKNGLRGRLAGPSGRRFGICVPLATGVMSWNRPPRHVYDSFDPKMVDDYQGKRSWGDQGYVFDRVGRRYRAFQDVFPGRVRSFKFDGLDGDRPDADIVCFHGRPRPWETTCSWVPPLRSPA